MQPSSHLSEAATALSAVADFLNQAANYMKELENTVIDNANYINELQNRLDVEQAKNKSMKEELISVLSKHI